MPRYAKLLKVLYLISCGILLMYLVNKDSDRVIIIGTSIGAVFLVLIFIPIVVILMVVCRHKKKIPGS